MRALGLVFVAALLAGADGCVVRQSCIDRGTETTYRGAADIAGQSAATVAEPSTVTVDDYAPTHSTCDESGAEFTVHVDGCLLRVHEVSHTTSRTDFSAQAAVLPGQSCTLGASTTLQITTGTLLFSPGALEVTLGGPTDGGYVTYAFRGSSE